MTHTSIESITLKEIDSARRLLIAFAHPDDESFGPGGTAIHYAKKQVAVHYVCGTRGEAGEVDSSHLAAGQTVADLRTQELRCAADILGFAGLHFLNYRDSGMEKSRDNQHPASLHQAPLTEVVEKITYLIRKIRPQAVLTFDPQGGYFHPDHIKMHQATTQAFHTAGDAAQFAHHSESGLLPYQPQKLYYTAFSHRMIKIFVKLLPLFGQDPAAFGKNKDINLERIVAIEAPITTRIKVSPYFELGQQAAACHTSQMENGPPNLPNIIQRMLSRYDTYTRIVPPFPTGTPRETDLFAGVSLKETD